MCAKQDLAQHRLLGVVFQAPSVHLGLGPGQRIGGTAAARRHRRRLPQRMLQVQVRAGDPMVHQKQGDLQKDITTWICWKKKRRTTLHVSLLNQIEQPSECLVKRPPS